MTWTHYRHCAGTSNPGVWLMKAFQNKWNTRKLLEEIKNADDLKNISEGILCPECGKGIDDNKAVTLVVPHLETGKRVRSIYCSPSCAILKLETLVESEVVENKPTTDVLTIQREESSSEENTSIDNLPTVNSQDLGVLI